MLQNGKADSVWLISEINSLANSTTNPVRFLKKIILEYAIPKV